MALSANYKVVKKNILNEIRCSGITLQELRFFSIYLALINPRDVSSRKVRFSLSDFQRIMEFGKLNIQQLKDTADKLLCKVVFDPLKNGGFSAFQIFKECTVSKDDKEEWYIEIDAHDKALPMLFDIRREFFSYELWNALRLKSKTQIRMYEILKQYEYAGERELSIEELRELLYIDKNDYTGRTGWSDFRKYVLDSCRQALKDNTNICFTYDRSLAGKGGKWLKIKFTIKKNPDYVDQLTLEEFIQNLPKQPDIDTYEYTEGQDTEPPISEPMEVDYGSELANTLGSAACNDEFTPAQIRVLQDLVLQAVPNYKDDLELCDYLIRQIHKMDVFEPNPDKRFNYLCKMIENDIKGALPQ